MLATTSRHAPPLSQGLDPISRRRLFGALAAAGLLASAAGHAKGVTSVLAQQGTPVAKPERIVEQGICYDTGTNYTPQWDVLTRIVWELDRVEREIAAIHDDLHCTSITIHGTNNQRLEEAAGIALEAGLHVWIQPRLIEAEPPALLANLTEMAIMAEGLRTTNEAVGLNLGVELSLFSTGIIPGATFEERVPTLLSSLDQLPRYNERLNELLASAASAARAVFNGPLTYGSGPWEGVDWHDMDYVGVDLYIDASNRATYRDTLRALHRYGKPVLITEFGCCTYEGAEDAGGSGYDIINWEATPLELNGDYVRSEQVQADTISELLDMYDAEGIYGASINTFVEPSLTYSPDARFDLDMASFGIVKPFPAATGQGYEETGYWEPKLAFTEIGQRFGTS